MIGGHLAFRCAFDPRVAAAVCYFATDIHSHTLGEGKQDDSLDRAGDIKGEIIMVGLYFTSWAWQLLLYTEMTDDYWQLIMIHCQRGSLWTTIRDIY